MVDNFLMELSLNWPIQTQPFQCSPGPLHSQSQGNGGQLLDGVEPQLDVLISKLVYQDGYGVERVVPSIVWHRHRRRSSISENMTLSRSHNEDVPNSYYQAVRKALF